jgi:cell division protein FtsB
MIWEISEEITRIEGYKERLLKENEKLKLLLALKDEPDYIEYLARKELGLVFPGEERYIIIEIEE